MHAQQRRWDAFGETITRHQFPNRTDGMSRSSGIRPLPGEGKDPDAFGPFEWCIIAYMAGITTGGILYQMGIWL